MVKWARPASQPIFCVQCGQGVGRGALRATSAGGLVVRFLFLCPSRPTPLWIRFSSNLITYTAKCHAINEEFMEKVRPSVHAPMRPFPARLLVFVSATYLRNDALRP